MARISKKELDKIARRIEATERAIAANEKVGDLLNMGRNEMRISGMVYVLDALGYVAQYKTNTEVEIKPLAELRHD